MTDKTYMNAGQGNQESSHRYGLVLSVLFMLFCLRVLAQLIQVLSPLSFLPPFHAWHSGALPYWVLLLSQLIIVALCLQAIRGLFNQTLNASLQRGYIFLGFGLVYFGAMLVRLIIGLTVATDHFWFSARLPTVFHLVLATFVLVYGHFHYRFASPSKASAILTS